MKQFCTWDQLEFRNDWRIHRLYFSQKTLGLPETVKPPVQSPAFLGRFLLLELRALAQRSEQQQRGQGDWELITIV